MGNSQLTIVDNTDDGKFFTKALFSAAMASIEAWGDRVNANLDQLRLDLFTPVYTFDDDGLANLATPLQTLLTTNLTTAITALTSRTSVNDVNYTVVAADVIVAVTGLTVTRTISLPVASGVTVGKIYYFKDETGLASPAKQIIIDGNAAETIDGKTTVAIASPYGELAIYSNGTEWLSISAPVDKARTAVADTNYTLLREDEVVAITSITAARTITLPAASTVPKGKVYRVKDESGLVSATLTVTIDGNAAETIDGQTTVALSEAYSNASFYSNGTAWFLV